MSRARRPSTTREDLLQGVIEYLAEHGVAKATFRALAARLDISTYPLVYYFGTKEQLLHAVLAEVERRQRHFAEKHLAEGSLLSFWQWSVENRELLRLDLEILLDEGRSAPEGPLANRMFRDWHRLWTQRFVAAGVPQDQARTKATLLVGGLIGLQIDLVVTGDVDRTSRAFHDLVASPSRLGRGPDDERRG